MIGVNFKKATAQRFLKCIASGEPISPSAGWTIDDMLMLAGVCFHAVSSHGPWQDRLARAAGHEPIPPSHTEQQEAVDEMHLVDLLAAIEFCAMLAQRVRDGEYDAVCEGEVSALLRGDTHQMNPVRGFRQHGTCM